MGIKTSRGFTLIELIIVITIIGILAAIALPRFIAAQTDARTAKLYALFGSIRTAATLAKARCELDLAPTATAPTCTAAGGTATMDGSAVTMVNRYPTANLAGIRTAAQLTNATADGITPSAGGPGAGAVLTIDIVGATTAANCRITYTAATAALPAQVTLPATINCS